MLSFLIFKNRNLKKKTKQKNFRDYQLRRLIAQSDDSVPNYSIANDSKIPHSTLIS